MAGHEQDVGRWTSAYTSHSSEQLAELIIARSGDVTWILAATGALAVGIPLAALGFVAGLGGAVVLATIGAACGFIIGRRAGSVLEAACLIVARGILPSDTDATGTVAGDPADK